MKISLRKVRRDKKSKTWRPIPMKDMSLETYYRRHRWMLANLEAETKRTTCASMICCSIILAGYCPGVGSGSASCCWWGGGIWLVALIFRRMWCDDSPQADSQISVTSSCPCTTNITPQMRRDTSGLIAKSPSLMPHRSEWYSHGGSIPNSLPTSLQTRSLKALHTKVSNNSQSLLGY